MPCRCDPGLLLATLVVALLAAVAASADSGAPPAVEPEARAFRVWPGIGAGVRAGAHVDEDHSHVGLGAATATQISFSMPLLSFVEPDVTVGFGFATVDDGGAFDPLTHIEMVNRFSFGLRVFAPPLGGAFDVDAPARPFLWGALHHGHKVSLGNTLANPLGAVLTATEAGVHHLTGIEGGGGVLLALDVDGRPIPVMLRASLSYLPSFAAVHAGVGHGDDVYALVDVAVGLPVVLRDL